MSILQWFLLILIVVLVAAVYWYIRRQAGSDPWAGMEDPNGGANPPPDVGPDDSYIVGVRTVSRETPADRKARVQAGREPRASAEVESAEPDRAARPVSEGPRGNAGVGRDDSGPTRAPEKGRKPARNEPGQDNRTEISPAKTSRVPMVSPQADENSEIFVLYVTSADNREFHGPPIHAALERADLVFGLNDMFHRVTDVNDVTESVFSVANMLNPGTLDPVDQDHLSTPGLAMFLLVPGPLEGRSAMRDMMETANQLAEDLGGQVLDDNRALLKAQTAQYMLDRIAEIDRRAKLPRRR